MLLTEHPRVAGGTLAALLVLADATVLTAQEFLVAYPGCGEQGTERSTEDMEESEEGERGVQ